MYPDIFNDKYPELNNLREASQVDVHKVSKFLDAKKTLKYMDPKTDDGFTQPIPIKMKTAVKCVPYMPSDNRRENIEEIVKKYKEKLDYLADQKDLWKILRNELTEKRQLNIMLKVLKNNLIFLKDSHNLDIYRSREEVEYIARTILKYCKECQILAVLQPIYIKLLFTLEVIMKELEIEDGCSHGKRRDAAMGAQEEAQSGWA